MPYKIRKVRGENLYYVYNPETKIRYSYEPLPKNTAMEQLRALYMKSGEEYKEKVFNPSKRRYPKGSEEAREAMLKARMSKKNYTKEEEK